jgi:hypothetical protein
MILLHAKCTLLFPTYHDLQHFKVFLTFQMEIGCCLFFSAAMHLIEEKIGLKLFLPLKLKLRITERIFVIL